jgi:hypothetical protein
MQLEELGGCSIQEYAHVPLEHEERVNLECNFSLLQLDILSLQDLGVVHVLIEVAFVVD